MPDIIWATPSVVAGIDDCFFYHSMDLPAHGLQEGQWDLRGRFRDYIGGVAVSRKRVLDVGCASGFLSFCAEREGASEVVSFDMDDARRQHMLPFWESEYVQNYEAWRAKQNAYIEKWRNAYWLAHRLYRSKAVVYYGDIYELPVALGKFDVSIVGAVLEHLADPIRALASIARLTSRTMVICTETIDTEDPVARFAGDPEKSQFNYVFWVYSLGTYRRVLKMLGFNIAHVSTGNYIYTPLHAAFPRTSIVAERAVG